MKKVTSILIISSIFIYFLSFCTQAQAQQSKDTVYITSSDIKKILDDKYYVRVPSSDLEQRLQDKVTTVVNNKFNFIYGLIGVISFLIGSILIFNLRSVVGNRIDSELTQKHIPVLNTKLNDHIAVMKETIKDNFSDLDKELELRIENFFYKNFKANLDAAVADLRQQQEKVLESQTEILKNSAEIMKERGEQRLEKFRGNIDRQQDLQKTMDGLKELLTEAEKNNDTEMISKVLNELSYTSFYLKKDAEFEKLLDTFADKPDINVSEAAFVNAALGNLYDYQNTGDTNFREKALKWLNQSLRKAPDYGEALGLKLELFMTDYYYAGDDAKKDQIKMEAEKLIQVINSKNITAFETITRFNRVQASSAKSKYIELIYQLFPDNMTEMTNTANDFKVKQSVS